MKKLTCALAILAAASTTALAGDLKQAKKATAPAAAATQMTDSEMDKVTAGSQGGVGHAFGQGTGAPGNGKGQGATNANSHSRIN